MSTGDRDWLDAMALSIRAKASLDYTLEQIVEHAKFATAGEEVGIHLRRGGRRVKAVLASSRLAHECDQLQVDLQEGPCVSAALDGPETILIRDLREDRRWPRWASATADLGWRSTLSVTLSAESEVIGSLNLYSRRPDHYDQTDAEVAVLFARHATAALAPALEIEGLRQAVDSRTVIGQAEGILMERYSITADQAFAVLRRWSQESQAKLGEVARRFVADHGSGGPDTGSGQRPDRG